MRDPLDPLPYIGVGGHFFSHPYTSMESKTCIQCGETKPLSGFYFRKDTQKLRNQCATCCADYARRRDTGWTPEQFKAAYEAQQGRCKICKTHADDLKQGLMADHCHADFSTRSLLCGRCNSGLGMFLDDPKLLRNAALYLEYHLSQPSTLLPSNDL